MSRYKGWLGLGAACLVLMTGCAQEPASAAAVVGAERIEMADVTEQVLAINETLGLPPDVPDAQMTNAVVRNNIVYQLVEQAAADAGVSVTQTAVDELMASQMEFVGGEDQLLQRAAQNGVAPQLIETDIRVSLLAEALAADLSAGQELPEEATQRLLVSQIQSFSVEVGTTANPRFGVWDVDQLAVVSDPDAPSQPAELSQLPTP